MKTTSELCCRIFVSVIKKYIYEAEFLFQARRPFGYQPEMSKAPPKRRGERIWRLLAFD